MIEFNPDNEEQNGLILKGWIINEDKKSVILKDKQFYFWALQEENNNTFI